jgi:hypothetical protein
METPAKFAVYSGESEESWAQPNGKLRGGKGNYAIWNPLGGTAVYDALLS